LLTKVTRAIDKWVTCGSQPTNHGLYTLQHGITDYSNFSTVANMTFDENNGDESFIAHNHKNFVNWKLLLAAMPFLAKGGNSYTTPPVFPSNQLIRAVM